MKTDVESVYLADWFSKQKPMPAIRTIRGDLEKGRNLYEQRCASCHAENGEGKSDFNFPSLTRLEGWYFYQQMRKFREGEHLVRIKEMRVGMLWRLLLSNYQITILEMWLPIA